MNRNVLPMVVMALVFISLCSSVLADLEILSFSCNSMSPTTNVETADNMVCEAVIKNTDSQNSAGVSSVSLYTTGGWANAESYAGTGFSSTISAGASTTASFSNVIANVPGDSHKFLYIDIDSSAYTEKVIDLTVNSMTFKTMTVTPSVSSLASGSEFDVNAYIMAGGSVSSASMTISLSGGCSLSSGESATKSIGSVSNNVEVSKSWKVTQGGSTCSVTVDASGISSPVTLSKSASSSVSFLSGGDDDSPASSGGGGGGGTLVTTHDIGALDMTGASAETSKNDVVKFKIRNVDHTATIVDLTNTQVKIEISSDPFNITMSVGETKKMDLDEDSTTFDLSLTLDSINATTQKANLTFKLISESIPQEPGVIPAGGVCVPNEKKCIGDELNLCRTDGMAWETTTCEHGCDSELLECRKEAVAPVEPGGPAAPGGEPGAPAAPSELPLLPLAAGVIIVVILLIAALSYKKFGAGKMHILSITAVLIILVSVSALISMRPSGYIIKGHETFVGCVSGEATLYGASWCGECREQNALFGDEFSSLDYVDCRHSSEQCVAEGVRAIPAWKIDGKLYGYLTLEELSELTGC